MLGIGGWLDIDWLLLGQIVSSMQCLGGLLEVRLASLLTEQISELMEEVLGLLGWYRRSISWTWLANGAS